MNRFSKIYYWIKLLFFTQEYRQDFVLKSSLSCSDIMEKLNVVFEGSYINENYWVDVSDTQVFIEHNDSSGASFIPTLGFFSSTVNIQANYKVDCEEITVTVQGCSSGSDNGMISLILGLQFFFVVLLTLVILCVSFFCGMYEILMALLIPLLTVLFSYWYYSHRIASMEFYSSKLFRTITYLEEDKPLSIIRSIWS